MLTEHEEAAQDYLHMFIVAAPIIVILALVGLLMIVGLWWAWARADRRLKGDASRGGTATSDIWRESGKRATGDDKPPSEPVRPSIPEELLDDEGPSDWTPEDGDEYDPNEPDDDEPWR
ncbi:MAG: hypothetical protein AAGB29_02485 [Planctomycetota bacterium]